MSGESGEFDALGPRWRNLLPKRWLPIALYFSAQALIGFACPILYFSGKPYQDLLGLLFTALAGSVLPIVILTAMSRTPPFVRLAIILGIALVCLAVYSLSLHPRFPVFAAVKAAAEDFLYHLREQVNQFAYIAFISHVLAGLLGAHVSAKPIDPAAVSAPPRGTILEWLYFMTLVGLMLMPEPKEVVASGLAGVIQSKWNDFFAALAVWLFLMGICLSVGIVVIGMVALLPLSAWRTGLLMLLGLTIGVGAVAIYLDHNPLDLAAMGGFLAINFYYSAALIPCWLLLRWAGYRLHLPSRWWWSRA